jgi:hypothetical protein
VFPYGELKNGAWLDSSHWPYVEPWVRSFAIFKCMHIVFPIYFLLSTVLDFHFFLMIIDITVITRDCHLSESANQWATTLSSPKMGTNVSTKHHEAFMTQWLPFSSLCNYGNKCVFFQLSSGDGLPSQVCQQCAQQVNASYDFKLRCESSDATLRQYLSKMQPNHKEGIQVCMISMTVFLNWILDI